MAISYTSNTIASVAANTTSTTTSFTVSGSAPLLVVAVSLYESIAPSSVTFNGQSLTKAVDQVSGDSNLRNASIWYLAAPPAGTYNVVVNHSSVSGSGAVDIILVNNASQINPLDATGSTNAGGTTPQATITTTNASDIVIQGVIGSSAPSGWTLQHSQTLINSLSTNTSLLTAYKNFTSTQSPSTLGVSVGGGTVEIASVLAAFKEGTASSGGTLTMMGV